MGGLTDGRPPATRPPPNEVGEGPLEVRSRRAPTIAPSLTFDIEVELDGISQDVQRARHLVSTIASNLSDAIAALSDEARDAFYEYIIAASTVLVEATGACVVLVQLPAR